MRKMVSIIVPMFNEEEVIEECYMRLKNVMNQSGYRYELIFVNDGSKDKTLEKLDAIYRRDDHVRVLNFSRNFGHQIAITAGMDSAKGDAIVVIDADLQDPPEIIKQMIDKWEEGYEVVYAKRKERKGETFFKKATASIFYRTLRSLTSVDIPLDTGDFRLIDRKVCNALSSIKEKNRFVRGLVSWVGFKQCALEYEREPRFAGETKYPLKKMMKLSLDAITSFSDKPLQLAIYLGFMTSGFSFIYLVYVLMIKLFTDSTISGWASIVSINLFFFGVILMILGIIGQYIGRIYDEARDRPLYIIESERNKRKEIKRDSLIM
ncbi:glycosyltransferase family 2 protein [Bacillus carboniphilus]|uniref:Glycosyltransferase family 2 protein n=1 Tax=Bacillus carboniphilus TaxID=86663 RepID=A0ABY9JQZ8_9BACI|nr:glycosyltransferase family 2 protein [Bacillus carboniphilus]WLR41234.1 glycosyltransferase family 2 protein [Bacillus carboniphilus]